MLNRISRAAPRAWGSSASSASSASNPVSAWGSIAGPVFAFSAPQRRAFTSSQPLAALAISFPKTSSTKLDELLEDIRFRIILPSYLPEYQRSRLYDWKWEARLKADPITMEIDGQKLRFYYTDIFSLPNTKAAFNAIVSQMKTHDDWSVLPRVLEGLVVQAGRRLGSPIYRKVIRRAYTAGCLHTILSCVREAKRTGFKLNDAGIVNDLLAYVGMQAIEADWDEVQTERALARSERIVDALQDEIHRQKKPGPEGNPRAPLHLNPLLLAYRLHMAAAMAIKHRGGRDGELAPKVTKFAQDVMALWPEGSEARASLYKATTGQVMTTMFDGLQARHGLELAAQVVADEQLASRLRKASHEVKEDLQALSRIWVGEGKGPWGSGKARAVYIKLYPDEVASDEIAPDSPAPASS